MYFSCILFPPTTVGVLQSPAVHSRQLRWSPIAQGFPEDEVREISAPQEMLVLVSSEGDARSGCPSPGEETPSLACYVSPMWKVQQTQTLQTVAPLQSLLNSKQ